MLCTPCQPTLRTTSARLSIFHIPPNMSWEFVLLLFFCGQVLLQRTLHILFKARETLVNYVWPIRVRIPEFIASQTKQLHCRRVRFSKEPPVSPRLPGASAVAIVCFVPTSCHFGTAAGWHPCLSFRCIIGWGRVSTVSIPAPRSCSTTREKMKPSGCHLVHV